MCYTSHPMGQTKDLVTITSVNFDYLTSVEKKVVHFLDEFKVTSSGTMIALDPGDESQIDKYTSKFMVMETFILKVFTCRVAYACIKLFCR